MSSHVVNQKNVYRSIPSLKSNLLEPDKNTKIKNYILSQIIPFEEKRENFLVFLSLIQYLCNSKIKLPTFLKNEFVNMFSSESIDYINGDELLEHIFEYATHTSSGVKRYFSAFYTQSIHELMSDCDLISHKLNEISLKSAINSNSIKISNSTFEDSPWYHKWNDAHSDFKKSNFMHLIIHNHIENVSNYIKRNNITEINIISIGAGLSPYPDFGFCVLLLKDNPILKINLHLIDSLYNYFEFGEARQQLPFIIQEIAESEIELKHRFNIFYDDSLANYSIGKHFELTHFAFPINQKKVKKVIDEELKTLRENSSLLIGFNGQISFSGSLLDDLIEKRNAFHEAAKKVNKTLINEVEHLNFLNAGVEGQTRVSNWKLRES